MQKSRVCESFLLMKYNANSSNSAKWSSFLQAFTQNGERNPRAPRVRERSAEESFLDLFTQNGEKNSRAPRVRERSA
ncbi:MAG: hypothetical protein ACQESH_08875, partial [Campylobacterota bacterium]